VIWKCNLGISVPLRSILFHSVPLINI
jgi:hypothetical protein